MRVYIQSDQGIGDEILYASMLKIFSNLDDDVVYEATPILHSLLQSAYPEVQFVKRAKTPGLDGFDLAIKGSDLRPHDVGSYLRPLEHYCERAVNYLTGDNGLTAPIGLAWFSQNSVMGPVKSTTLDKLAPLFATGRDIVNLQYGDTYAETRGYRIFKPAADPLVDMYWFFAVVNACETVITTSNTTLHVAGALGKRTFLLLPADVEGPWYWNNMPYRSVTVCKGSGEAWATEALQIALSQL